MDTTAEHPEIRWAQRFESYRKALAQLRKAVLLSRQRALSELEGQGLIQAFEFTHELAWQVMKDYFEYQGNTLITGSRDATREAFRRGLLADGDTWMAMIRSRNSSVHTDDEKTAREIIQAVTAAYYERFSQFEETMLKLTEAR